jgi:hypothetical protein
VRSGPGRGGRRLNVRTETTTEITHRCTIAGCPMLVDVCSSSA